MKIKSVIHIIIVIGVIFLISSCKEKLITWNVNCDECYDTEYDSVDLNVSVTINDKYLSVPLILYRGDVEENQVDWVDTANGTEYYVSVAVGQQYSIKLEYTYDSDTIYVIDGTKIKMKRVSDQCDAECWVIENDKIDGRLKYK